MIVHGHEYLIRKVTKHLNRAEIINFKIGPISNHRIVSRLDGVKVNFTIRDKEGL